MPRHDAQTPRGRETEGHGWQIRNAGEETLELLIYDTIGASWDGDGVEAKAVAKTLREHRDVSTIHVIINSAGGYVFDAVGIYNLLNRHTAEILVDIDGMALSSASIVAMAGDRIRIAENALIMIHDPYVFTSGTAEELRKVADDLERAKGTIAATYAARTKLSKEEASALMAAETWIDAEEAVARGFADEVTPAKRMAACADPDAVARMLNGFRNVPAGLREMVLRAEEPPALPAAARAKETRMSEENKGTQGAAPEKPAAENTATAATATVATTSAASATATIAELKAAFPKADNNFLVECLEKTLTLAQAKDAWLAKLEAVNAEQATALAQAQEAAKSEASAAGTATGAEPVRDRGSAASGKNTGNAAGEWRAAVEAKVQAGASQADAVRQVRDEDPDLHERYIDEHNTAHPNTDAALKRFNGKAK